MQPLKWHGGKGAFNGKLAKWIISLMPPHTHYVEPYAGGLSVLLTREPEGVSEVVNDLNCDLINFWTVLQNDALFKEFRRMAEATPFSESEWKGAGEILNGDGGDYTLATGLPGPAEAFSVVCALAFFIRCRQSMAGRMKSFAPLSRTRTRQGMNEQAAAWITAVDGLPEVHARLRRVVVLGPRPALEVIRQQDGPDTLFYLDPPYLLSTRTATAVYAHEMTEADHVELLDVLQTVEGKVMLSGYRSQLYDDALSTWTRHDYEIVNNAAGGKTKGRETECLWCNFP